MNRHAKFGVAMALLSQLITGALRAESSPSGEDRLRQMLRETTAQLRQSQADLAALQAEQSSNGDAVKTMKEQIALLAKHNADDQAESAKAVEALKAKLAERESEVARLENSLNQWKVASEKMNQASGAAEQRLAKAIANATLFERRAEDLKGKNAELFRIGSEILERYEKFSLGQQFLSREPFIGRARVDLENQVQDLGDQMESQKAQP
jgi:chromosome segregation ATPase